jgi:hypothetical protein
MRLLRLLLLIQLFSLVSYAQDRSFIRGETQDCFAGKLIHPAQVDIYIIDALKSPEIMGILDDLEKQIPQGNEQNVDAYFASYKRLTSAIQKTARLGHTRSDPTGRFSFRDLKARRGTVLLGIAEREDEPAYYAYARVQLKPGMNFVKLDFDRGQPCDTH